MRRNDSRARPRSTPRLLAAAALVFALGIVHGTARSRAGEPEVSADTVTPRGTAAPRRTVDAREIGAGVGVAVAPVNIAGSVDTLYERTAPSVVGVTCVVRQGRAALPYFGTGTIITPDGLVLTSFTVVPENARDIRIYLRGGRTTTATLLEVSREKEVAILRVDEVQRVAGSSGLPFVRLGSSGALKVGDAAYTFGNAFNCIETDDQVAMAAGVVSGLLRLEESHHPEATYLGPVIETSAALNNGMDGGPLIDDRGRLVGLLSLNFSLHRWLGTAVPISEIKAVIDRHRPWLSDGDLGGAIALGVEIAGDAKGLRVATLDQGAAASAGLRVDDRIESVDGRDVRTIEELRAALTAARPGVKQLWRLRRGDGELELEVTPWGRF